MLSDVEKATLAALLRQGQAGRRSLAEETGLSFPTISQALSALQLKGQVGEVRREQGARGRATIVYAPVTAAGWVLGIDLGVTQMSLLAQGLDGTELASEFATHGGDGAATEAGRRAAAIIARLAHLGPPMAVALALSQIVPRRFDDAGELVAPGLVRSFCAGATLPSTVPLLIENNVNCAAVAEHHSGRMAGRRDAAFLQIGVGIGLGFICDGRLQRGGHGASGELAHIPLAWEAGTGSPANALERRYGSLGLLDSLREAWPRDAGKPPGSIEAVFSLAQDAGRQGEVVRQVLDRHAVALGRIAAAAASVLDPEVMVLGGGLAADPGFVARIRDEFQSFAPATELVATAAGAQATLLGAALLARDLALSELLGPHHRRLLSHPVLWNEGRAAATRVAENAEMG